jgi:hypothetical protein
VRSSFRLAVTAVAAVALLTVTGCGDDDADLGYCDALAALAAEGAAIGPDAEPDEVGSALDLWEQVARTAPTEAADAARTMADAATVVSEAGSDAPLDLEAVAQAGATLAASAAESCGVDLLSGPDS